MTVDELLPIARQLIHADGGVPSKRAIRSALRVSWDRAGRIAEALTAEIHPVDSVATVNTSTSMVLPRTRRHRARVTPVRRVRRPRPVSPTPVELRRLHLLTPSTTRQHSRQRPWAAWALAPVALSAFGAVWSGWVDLGRLTGFGIVHPLPGIVDGLTINTAITLPLGLEAYAAYALSVWLGGQQGQARRFAKWSSLGALTLGCVGQVSYHLMVAAGWRHAPWPITAVVACIPVIVLGLGAGLYHLCGVAEGEGVK